MSPVAQAMAKRPCFSAERHLRLRVAKVYMATAPEEMSMVNHKVIWEAVLKSHDRLFP